MEIAKFMDEDTYPAYVDVIAREAANRAKLLEIAEATGTDVVLTNDSHMPSDGSQAELSMALKSFRLAQPR